MDSNKNNLWKWDWAKTFIIFLFIYQNIITMIIFKQKGRKKGQEGVRMKRKLFPTGKR